MNLRPSKGAGTKATRAADLPAVVTRPFPGSGLGSNLLSLAGAVWMAGRLGRRVLIDWRGMLELKDQSLDYFMEFFEPPGRIHDVAIGHSLLEDSYLAASADGLPFISANEAAALVRSGAAPKEHYVVVQAYHGLDRMLGGTGDDPLRERHRFLKGFYASIRPRSDVRAAIDHWYQEHLLGSFVIGVNIRTGNGSPRFTKGGLYTGRFDQRVIGDSRFLQKINQACKDRLSSLPRFLRHNHHRILIVTDSGPMHAQLTRLPEAVARRNVFPPFGADHEFSDWLEESGYEARDSITDTIGDMFLLARANALVYNDTNFNRYALTVTDYFNGNAVNIEKYFVSAQARRARGLARARWAALRG